MTKTHLIKWKIRIRENRVENVDKEKAEHKDQKSAHSEFVICP